MKIFFICQRVPFPPNRGDKISTFNELRYLAQRHEVHVFCLADGVADLENVAGARRYASSVTAVPVDRRRSKLRALQALLTGRSMSVAMFSEDRLHAAIRKAAAEQKPDLFFVFSSNVAQYAEPFAGAPRVMQFADLDSVKFTSYAASLRPPMRWVYAVEGRRLLDYERHIAASFSHSLVCTALEQRDFERLIPGPPVSLVGNGVDLEFFRTANVDKAAGEIVFTGVMDYYPNIEAVTWFCDAILPLVQRRVPQARFTICGSRPTQAVQRLAERPGVGVTGWVEDIRPYLDRAEVFVAPLRIARGIQNKVIEAMAMALPVVSSERARAGTGIPDGEGIVAADEPQVFADNVVRLLQDHALRAAMGRRARQVVEQCFTWDAQLAALREVIDAVTANRSSLRPVGGERQGEVGGPERR